MPSKNPRMILTLKPATYRAVVRTAKAAEVFPSRLVSAMLDDMVPMLNSMADLEKVGREKRAEAFDHLGAALGNAQLKAHDMQHDLLAMKRKASRKV